MRLLAIISLVMVTLISISPIVAQQQDPLDFLDGVWVSTSPPGPHIAFTKVALGTREASLPTIGQASIRMSNGEQGSNVKVSGPGFDCFYFVTPIQSGNSMVWELKGGSAVCVPNAVFERVTPPPLASPAAPIPPASRSFGCTVADPTGTPLNVRDSPFGNILRALPNGIRVRAVEARNDYRGTSWSRITDNAGGSLGWVLTRYLSCSAIPN